MKTFLIFTAFCLISVTGFSQKQLNENSQRLKDAKSVLYFDIKKYAVDKWKEDHEMIVYEINQQVDALFKITAEAQKKDGYDETIMVNALGKWSEGDSGSPEFKTDYTMVWYEYQKQMKAKKAY